MISIYKQKKPHGRLSVGFLFFSNYDIIKASEKSVKIVNIRFTKKHPGGQTWVFLFVYIADKARLVTS